MYLTEEEQVFFSPNQDETNYEDLDDPAIDFQNAIIEAHRQYDLRSKRTKIMSRKVTQILLKSLILSSRKQ